MDDDPVIFKDIDKPKWSMEDIARELGYLTLHGADWAQTRTIAKNPLSFHETNPILGVHPSVGKVNNYFLGTALGHMLLMELLPSEYRKWAQYGTIGLEAGVAGRNKVNFGIGMTF